MEFNLPWNNATFQWRTRLLLGFQGSSQDDFGQKTCENKTKESHIDPYACSGLVAQPFLALSLYERIRFQVGISYYEKAKIDIKQPFSILMAAGFQF